MRVELTPTGSLVIPAQLAQERLGDADSVLVSAKHGELLVSPIGPRGVGGLILKRRNAKGDRSVLVLEQLPHDQGVPAWDSGPRDAAWDPSKGSLRVPLTSTDGGAA